MREMRGFPSYANARRGNAADLRAAPTFDLMSKPGGNSRNERDVCFRLVNKAIHGSPIRLITGEDWIRRITCEQLMNTINETVNMVFLQGWVRLYARLSSRQRRSRLKIVDKWRRGLEGRQRLLNCHRSSERALFSWWILQE
jgi:hypothetical protein